MCDGGRLVEVAIGERPGNFPVITYTFLASPRQPLIFRTFENIGRGYQLRMIVLDIPYK